ncbi:MAG TPA: ester cyclase [Ornithinibacter sp.]|nr:ester cyclase [Ornithinibacter sp.]
MAATQPPTVPSTELFEWVFDTLNAQDLDALRPFWTSATVEHFPDATCHGGDEVAAYFEDKFAAIEDFHLEPIAIVVHGEDAFVHWRLTGRHVGRLLGVEGTGREIAVAGIDHFVVHDGTVATNTVVFDQLAFARQVGLLPADGSTPDRALKAAFNGRTRLLTVARRRLRR